MFEFELTVRDVEEAIAVPLQLGVRTKHGCKQGLKLPKVEKVIAVLVTAKSATFSPLLKLPTSPDSICQDSHCCNGRPPRTCPSAYTVNPFGKVVE